MKLPLKLFGTDQEGRELNLLPDQPTKTDSIGGTHDAVAETLRDIICSDMAKPFVVGLFGSWGSGKSSVIEMLKQKSEGRFRLVIVDAWRKDKDNFLRHFVKKLARTLLPESEAEEVVKEVSSRRTDLKHNWKPDKAATWVFGVFIAIVVGLAIFLGYQWQQDKTFPAGPFGQLAFVILAAVFFQWILPRHEIRTNSSTQEITLDDPVWFRDIYFRKILGPAKAPLVCIAIDNLDRVPAEDAMKIIRTIKTFIVEGSDDDPREANDVVFLVPCDDEALAARFAHDSVVEDGKEFLRKVFNVGLRIPMLQPQDSVSYVRDLLKQAGLTFSHDLLDRVAFVIATAVGQTPRKPKYLINYYLSRLHLCHSLRAAKQTVEEHPDWFAIFVVLESEFSSAELPSSVEALHEFTVTPPHPASEEQRRMRKFLLAVRPIAKEIQADAWHIFLFLKHPRIHELIPGFRELFDAAVSLDVETFNKRLPGIYEKRPDVLNYLWDERKDVSSRMNVASAIAGAVEQNVSIKLPIRVVDDIASLMEQITPGWDALPPQIAYEKVLKHRPQCLAHMLTSATSGENGNNRNKFVSIITHTAMPDMADNAVVAAAIVKVLDAYAKADQELVVSALKFPRYSSRAAFLACLPQWQSGRIEISIKSLLQYGTPLFLSNQDGSNSPLKLLIRALRDSLVRNPQRHWIEDDCAGYLELIGDLLANKFPLPQPGDGEFGQVLDRLMSSFNPVRHDKGAYLLLAAFIRLTKPNRLNIQETVVKQRLQQIVPDFLSRGDEDAIAETIRNDKDFFQNNFGQNIDAVGCRSARLFDEVIVLYPNRRRSLIQTAIARGATNVLKEWSATRASNLDLEAKLATFDALTAQITRDRTSPYEIINNLGILKEPSALIAIEKHFDGVLQQFSPLSTLKNLFEAARRMDLVGYSPTAQQKDLFRKGLADIEQSTMTSDQKVLIRKLIK